MMQDLRHGVRLLFKNPGFTALAVLVLALGIGANTAVFSLVNAMMFRPMASDGPGIVGIYSRDTARPDRFRSFSWDDYQLIRSSRDVFDEVAAQTMTTVGTTEGERTRRSFSGVVTSGYFSTMRVALAAGREFTDEESHPAANVPVVIVGHPYARRAGVTPAQLPGRSVRINNRDFTIVGVAPEGFAGTMALIAPEFWLPTGVYDSVSDAMFREDAKGGLGSPATRLLMLLGRLRPGLGDGAAAPAMASLTTRFVAADPAGNRAQALMVQKLPRLSVSTSPGDDSKATALGTLLMGMAALVLLVACLNLANMLLARGTSRRKEIALRLALGGGRGRIIRQLLTESLLIAALGGVAGLLLAVWGTALMTATFAAVLPMVVTFDPSPDLRVLAATAAFAVMSTVGAGLGPALRVTRPDLLTDLKELPASGGGGRRFSARNVLVVGQVALSLALLTAAGLFMRGAVKAAVADPGFPLEGGIVAGLDPALAGYDETQSREAFRAVLDRVRRTPGVEAASVASLVPFGEFSITALAQKEGTPPPADGQRPEGVTATMTVVGTDYFEALRIPVLRGRAFTPAEEAAAGPDVAVVDEPFAKRLFGDEDPIGRRLQLERASGRLYEIVGVVAGVRHDLFDKVPSPHLYLPFGQNYRSSMHLHVRVAGGGDTAERAAMIAVQQGVRDVDPRVPLLNMKTLRAHRDGGIMLWAVNTGARLFSVFGGVALLLAIIGIYGVKSYVVSRRTREIGVRMALGATPGDVLWLILKEGLALTVIGVGIGLGLSWMIARLLSGMLYEVSAVDPMVFVIAPVLLTVSAMLASYVPARRATRVLPLTALRSE